MNGKLFCFICVHLFVMSAVSVVHAQYILPYDTLQKVEEDTAKAVQPRGESVPEDSIRTPKLTEKALLEMAQTWIRRLLFRGFLETKVVGAYAQYQLTAWSEISGSFGPVEARITVSYLGATNFAKKKAEWLQVMFQTMESEPQLVEFDLTIPASPEVRSVYQAYYRVNKGVIRDVLFGLPEGTYDPDSSDHPVSEGTERIRLFTGNFETEKFRGIGDGGVDVVIYRNAEVPPLSIVRLGYGDQGLTYTGGGMDAAPRFLPPGLR